METVFYAREKLIRTSLISCLNMKKITNEVTMGYVRMPHFKFKPANQLPQNFRLITDALRHFPVTHQGYVISQ
jgi:hypothetical protein